MINIDEFKKELTELLNKHSIESTCDMPDFIMADMVFDFLYSCGASIKRNTDWHTCGSETITQKTPL